MQHFRRVAEKEITISSDMMSRIGTTAKESGTSWLEMGLAASSEMRKVETNSEIESSPICRLPVARSDKISRI